MLGRAPRWSQWSSLVEADKWHVTHMMTTRRLSSRGTAARVILGVGALFALIEILFILLVLLGANSGNAFYRFVHSLAGALALFFPGLFDVSGAKLQVILDYGLAAVFWIVVTGLIARAVA
jgi:hypothetical protein